MTRQDHLDGGGPSLGSPAAPAGGAALEDRAPGTTGGRGSGCRRSRGLLGLLVVRPTVLVVSCAAMWGYVHRRPLDFIERQTLNPSVLTDAVRAHVQLSLLATLLIVAIATPIGIIMSRPWARVIAPGVLAVANAGQAFPAIGLVTLLAIRFGIGTTVAVAALTVSGVLPTLHNTVTGLRTVDPAIVQAARGMGMRAWQALVRVELPLAVPVILAGIRTTVVLAVGVATLATFINAGGLGDVIIAGIKLDRTPVLLTGSLLTIVVAFTLDWLVRLVEEFVRPRGL